MGEREIYPTRPPPAPSSSLLKGLLAGGPIIGYRM